MGRMPKELRQLDRLARQNGFVLVRADRHLVYRHPQIAEQLIVGKSISDRRAQKNNLARLRRLLRHLPEQSSG